MIKISNQIEIRREKSSWLFENQLVSWKSIRCESGGLYCQATKTSGNRKVTLADHMPVLLIRQHNSASHNKPASADTFFINFAYHTFAFCVHLHDVGHKECKNFIVFVQVVIVFIVWSRQVGLNLIERLSLLKWVSKFSFVSIKFPLKESQDEFKVGAEKMRFFALEYTAHPLARFSENVSRYYATCFACHQVDLVKRDLSSIRLAQVKGFRDRITVY